MMHIWVGKLGHPWCRWWLFALSAPCNYLDRGWLYINYILAGISHISQCDLIQMFPMEHNSVSTISTILYRHKCVKYVRMFSKCGHSSQLTELYNALAFVDVLRMKSGRVYLLCRIYSTEIFDIQSFYEWLVVHQTLGKICNEIKIHNSSLSKIY